MYLAFCVQIQTMGPITLKVIHVKIILMGMQICKEYFMEYVIRIMIMETLFLEKCAVNVVAARTSAEI